MAQEEKHGDCLRVGGTARTGSLGPAAGMPRTRRHPTVDGLSALADGQATVVLLGLARCCRW